MDLNLLATRRRIWTTPTDPRTRQRLDELRQIDQRAQIDPRTKEQKQQRAADEERRQQLIARLPAARDYRFTVQTTTARNAAQHPIYIRQFNEWFKQEYEIDVSDHFAADQNADQAAWRERQTTIMRGYGWAATMTALIQIETRERPILDDQSDQEWQPIPIPDAWRTFAGYRDQIPDALALALEEEAHAVNPGLWRLEDTDEAKKTGGISADP